jgi:2-methylcitrate dehydratase PrpD
MRALVSVQAVDSFRKDEARVTVVTRDGQRHEHHVEHATGTRDNPMSDEALETKFLANAQPVIGDERARTLADAVWKLETMSDVRDLVALAA